MNQLPFATLSEIIHGEETEAKEWTASLFGKI